MIPWLETPQRPWKHWAHVGTICWGVLSTPTPPPSMWTRENVTSGASISLSAKPAVPVLPGPFQDDMCDLMIDGSGR